MRSVVLMLLLMATGCFTYGEPTGTGGGGASGGGTASGGGGGATEQDAGVPDAGPSGSGNSTTSTVGATGGSLQLEGLTLDVPAGALAAATTLKITATTTPAPSGYEAYSPVYKFEPEGTMFTKPVRVSIPFTGDARLARLFWSRQGTTGFERLGGTVSGSTLTMEVTHFSSGFVANGVDYTDPPDLSCTVTKLLEGRAGQPASSSVSVFFTVDDCQGRPVTGLSCADYPGTCDFVVKEDGAKLSTEAQTTVLGRQGLTVFASLVLDVSASTQGKMAELIDGAKAFVDELQVRKGLAVPISIQLFAGEATLREWQPPTLNTQLLLSKLDAVATYQPVDVNSTNLYGAVVTGLSRLDAAQADFRTRNFGGAFTTGYLVLFTDGADTSGLVTEATARSAVSASANQVMVAALQSADFDQSAYQSLAALAPNAVVVAQGAQGLYGDFANLAARIAGQMNRTYLLGYCSPKRAGSHTVAVELAQGTPRTSASYPFSAANFMPGCTKAAFESACTGKQCGGLGCGACDDRAAACTAATQQCTSYCAGPPLVCGGQTITNPRGYEQVCADSNQVALCAGACRVLASDRNHCGACGNVCATGAGCIDANCTCPAGQLTCGTACANNQTDRNNCGSCGNACAASEVCSAGVCGCSVGQDVCGVVCVNKQIDRANCGGCGSVCATGATCNAGVCVCPTGQAACGGGVCRTLDTLDGCGSCLGCGALLNTCDGTCGLDTTYSWWRLPFPASGRFVSSGASVVDVATGLAWLVPGVTRPARPTASQQQTVYDYCRGLTGTPTPSGRSWRVPSVLELSSLIGASGFSGGASGSFWIDLAPNGVSNVTIRLPGGLATSESSAFLRDVICVDGLVPTQSSNTASRYELVSFMRVRDRLTGLEWQRASDGVRRTSGDAASFCATLTYDGVGGWRLPSVSELISLHGGASGWPTPLRLDLSYFLDQGPFVSSTQVIGGGVVTTDTSGHVLCVR